MTDGEMKICFGQEVDKEARHLTFLGVGFERSNPDGTAFRHAINIMPMFTLRRCSDLSRFFRTMANEIDEMERKYGSTSKKEG